MIIFLLILAIFMSIFSILYSKYCFDKVISRLSFIEAIPNLYDNDWWLNDE